MVEYASEIGDLDVAKRCYKGAIADADYLGRIEDRIDCLFGITSQVYGVCGRCEEDLSNYQLLSKHYDKVNDSRMRTAVLKNIASIHHNKGEHDQAMELHNQSLEIRKE